MFTTSTSWGVAQGFAPGRVPRMYCSFSPSALMMWLKASSSMAMEAIIMVRASSRVRSAPLGGKEGIDIFKILHSAARLGARTGCAAGKALPPFHPMRLEPPCSALTRRRPGT